MSQEANAWGNAQDMLTWDGWPGRSRYWQESSFRQASFGRTESQIPERVFASKGALTKRTRLSNHRQ